MRSRWAVVILSLTFILAAARPGAAAIRTKAEYWRKFQQAAAFKEAGRVDEAMPLWAELSEASADLPAVRDYKNAGLFAKWLAHALEERGRLDEALSWYDREVLYFQIAGVPDWEQGDLARIAALRTDFRVFVTRRVPAPAALARYEPPEGAYLGLYLEGEPPLRTPGRPPAYHRAADVFGKKHAFFLVYAHWGKPFPLEDALAVQAAGAALQVSLEPPHTAGSLEAVQDGAWLAGWARAAGSLGIPVFLRFAPEMNGDWVPWHQDPDLYIEKWRLVTRVVRQYAPNVAMVWTPYFVGDPATPMERYYPGDEYVDWVGINFYSDYYFNRSTPAADVPPFRHIEEVYRKFAGRKPIMIAEFGIANRDYRLGPAAGEDVTAWAEANIRTFYASLPQLFPRVKAVVYWSVDQARTPNPTGREILRSSYLLSEKTAVLDAYREAIRSPYYLSDVVEGPTAGSVTAYRPAAYTPLRAAEEELTAYVKARDLRVSRVEYLVDGAVVGQSSSPPFAVRYDFTPHAGRTVQLQARAYAAGGEVVATFAARVPVGDPAAAFTDMTAHWARDTVAGLARQSIVSGFEDGTFRPSAPVSRAAFVKIALAATGRLPQGPADTYFLDVPRGDWFHPWAAEAVAAGAVRPEEFPERRFRPADPVTRLDMAVIAARLAGLPVAAGDLAFGDAAQIPADLRGYVAAAVRAGLLSGYPDGTFRPGATATRAEAAVIAQRLVERVAR